MGTEACLDKAPTGSFPPDTQPSTAPVNIHSQFHPPGANETFPSAFPSRRLAQHGSSLSPLPCSKYSHQGFLITSGDPELYPTISLLLLRNQLHAEPPSSKMGFPHLSGTAVSECVLMNFFFFFAVSTSLLEEPHSNMQK